MRSPLFEADMRAGNEIVDCARDENLTVARCGSDARADVDADAGELPVSDLELAGVKARPDGAGIELDPVYCDVILPRWQTFSDLTREEADG